MGHVHACTRACAHTHTHTQTHNIQPTGSWFYFLNFFKLINFLAALGLRCCARAFSSCSERGLLFVAMRRLLITVASLVAVAEHRLQAHGLQ